MVRIRGGMMPSFRITVDGAERLITKYNGRRKLIKSSSKRMTNMIADDAIAHAGQVIMQNTSGFGFLADSFVKTPIMAGDSHGVSIKPIAFHAPFVEDSFKPHWVSVKSSRDPSHLKAWMSKHGIEGERMFVGGPNAAQWVKSGGLKYMEKTFDYIKSNVDKYKERVRSSYRR